MYNETGVLYIKVANMGYRVNFIFPAIKFIYNISLPMRLNYVSIPFCTHGF